MSIIMSFIVTGWIIGLMLGFAISLIERMKGVV